MSVENPAGMVERPETGQKTIVTATPLCLYLLSSLRIRLFYIVKPISAHESVMTTVTIHQLITRADNRKES